MFDIRSAIPRPTPVTLGRRDWLASELRLGDLADLQQYIATRIPSPWSVAGPFLTTNPGGLAWRRLLAETYDAQQEWPPLVWSPEGLAVLSDDRGVPFFTWMVLRREQRSLRLDRMPQVLAGATGDQIAMLGDVAWGIQPIAGLDRIVDAFLREPDEGGAGGKAIDWIKARHEYMTKCRVGPPFEELTLTQFKAFRSGGDMPDPGAASGDLADFDWARRGRREDFWEWCETSEDAEYGRSDAGGGGCDQ